MQGSSTPNDAHAAISGIAQRARERALTQDLAERELAIERARGALELLALAQRESPWSRELAFRWRSHASFGSVSGSGAGLKIQPCHASPTEAAASENWISQPDVELATLVDLAAVAAKLVDGTVTKNDAQGARQLSDALRSALTFCAEGSGFNGRSASALKERVELAEAELAKAMHWACRYENDLIPRASVLGSSGGSWDRRVSREDSVEAARLATALGWPALGAEIERRALAEATASASGSSPAGSERPRPGL